MASINVDYLWCLLISVVQQKVKVKPFIIIGLFKHENVVQVRYTAVRAGGGCSLEVQLCPVALMCNATPIALTLRAYDAAPLCKLEPGTAISPPTNIIKVRRSFHII